MKINDTQREAIRQYARIAQRCTRIDCLHNDHDKSSRRIRQTCAPCGDGVKIFWNNQWVLLDQEGHSNFGNDGV